MAILLTILLLFGVALHAQTPVSAQGTPLRAIVIEGRRSTYPPSLEEPYRRAASGKGKYFTHEQIDSLAPAEVRSLLATVPTVQVNDRGVTFQKCTSGLNGLRPADALTISNRPFAAPNESSLRKGSPVAVYVDGVRLTRADALEPEDADRVLRRISPQSIQLLEVYSGQSRIPGEYGADACAVILVWTRR